MVDVTDSYTLQKERELERLRADAARYRWLKNTPEWLGWDHDFRPDEVEREIDRAMADTQPKEPAAPQAKPVAWMLYCKGEPAVPALLFLHRTEAELASYRFHTPKIVPLYTKPKEPQS